MVLINREFISKSVIGCDLQKADLSLRLPLRNRVSGMTEALVPSSPAVVRPLISHCVRC